MTDVETGDEVEGRKTLPCFKGIETEGVLFTSLLWLSKDIALFQRD